VLNGLFLWLVSDNQRFTLTVTNPISGQQYDLLPAVALLAAPISAAVVVAFLTAAGSRRWGRALAVILGLVAMPAYVIFIFPTIWPKVFQQQYLSLMVMRLALLAWAGVGVVALSGRFDARSLRLLVSRWKFVVAGLFAMRAGSSRRSRSGCSALDINHLAR
jgi:hypothetical protein